MLRIVSSLTWREVLFTVKTFAAGMLALYIAFRLDLSQPSWALTTVYIVSQPYAGMVLSKSLYRVLGTVIGAIATLVFVALFANSRELFCLALALWIGGGTFVAMMLRDAPPAYMGMLSGYSAAIIGLPAVLAPDTAFDLAVSRCLEIMLGIACGALIHHVVFPQRAGLVLRRVLIATLPDMARWTRDALTGARSETEAIEDRRRMIATVLSLDSLRMYAALDTARVRAVEPLIRQLEGKLLSALALLVSIHDRLVLLRRRYPQRAQALTPLLQDAAGHFDALAQADPQVAASGGVAADAALNAAIATALPSPAILRGNQAAFLERTILLRLADVVAMWREAITLRGHIATGDRVVEIEPAPTFHPYRDVGFALLGGAVSTVTVIAASAFWIATAWPSGPTAVTFAGIICAILGGRDDPAAGATVFFNMSIVGAVLSAFYLFWVLPPLDSFGALALALAPFYLICGIFLTRPTAAPYVMPIIFNSGGLLSVSNQMSYDIVAFLNTAAAYLVGIGIGAAALSLLRPIGAEWAVERLVRGLFRDLARTAQTATLARRTRFESRTFDRINALLSRLDPVDVDQRAVMQGGLASLRVGLNMLALGSYVAELAPPDAAAVTRALEALGTHFTSAARRGAASPLEALMAARAQLVARIADDALLTRTAEALYSIEMTLRQHAGFFRLAETDALDVSPAEAVTA